MEYKNILGVILAVHAALAMKSNIVWDDTA
jgi:hypothetical protein